MVFNQDLILFEIRSWMHLIKAWSNRGMLWKAKGDLRQAEEDLTHAIELDPQLANAYAHRGIARLLQWRAGDAQSDFDRYLSLDGNSKENLDRLIAEAKQQLQERGKQ
jgi:tetratricopeptide (TPR) repeat protein